MGKVNIARGLQYFAFCYPKNCVNCKGEHANCSMSEIQIWEPNPSLLVPHRIFHTSTSAIEVPQPLCLPPQLKSEGDTTKTSKILNRDALEIPRAFFSKAGSTVTPGLTNVRRHLIMFMLHSVRPVRHWDGRQDKMEVTYRISTTS